MTADEYNNLEPRAARERAQKLSKDAQLRLAVALSATRSPCGVGAVYNFWLRLWGEKPEPKIRQATLW